MLEKQCPALTEVDNWIGIGDAYPNVTRTTTPPLFTHNWVYVISPP